ncbi:MAG: HDOD domain-containing protein [Myxococcota bacterium]
MGSGAANCEDDVGFRDAVLETIEAVITSEDFRLPAMPGLASAFMEMNINPNADAGRVADLIDHDRRLRTRLMRIANSPIYRSHERRVDDSQEAVARIGLMETHNFAVFNLIKWEMFVGTHRLLRVQLCRDAVGAAVGCELIGKRLNMPPDHIFLLGLLFDIGRPALIDIIDELLKTRAFGRARFEQVWQVVDDDLSDRLTREIMTHWSMPNTIRERLLEARDAPETRLIIEAARQLARARDRHTISQIIRLYAEDLGLNDASLEWIVDQHPMAIQRLAA